MSTTATINNNGSAIALPESFALKLAAVFMGKSENPDTELGYNQVVREAKVKALKELTDSVNLRKIMEAFGDKIVTVKIDDVQQVSFKMGDTIHLAETLLQTIDLNKKVKKMMESVSLTGKERGRKPAEPVARVDDILNDEVLLSLIGEVSDEAIAEALAA